MELVAGVKPLSFMILKESLRHGKNLIIERLLSMERLVATQAAFHMELSEERLDSNYLMYMIVSSEHM